MPGSREAKGGAIAPVSPSAKKWRGAGRAPVPPFHARVSNGNTEKTWSCQIRRETSSG